ncbi:hypothetical protein HAHE_18240 [Haloferula helveola]|uniref:Oxygen sensor histidine kinase NreB n=1 Tax=Haloferula helveola TaxID=490095 RepID=A0ABN6H2W9_9BACT|nr:hypothetical protein HAHE_18240 [Haloferula helveola]
MRWLLTALFAILTCRAPAAESLAAGYGFLVHVWQSEDGLPGNVVRSIGQTEDGFLWVATAEGIARFDGLGFTSIGAQEPAIGRRFAFFRVFTPEDHGVWISTSLGGLFRITDNELVEVIEGTAEANPPLVTRLFSHDEQIHFIRSNDVWRLDADGPVQVADPSEDLVASMVADQRAQIARGRRDDRSTPTSLEDSDEDRWIVSGDTLLHEGQEGAGAIPVIPELDGQLTVSDMLEDKEGNLWLSSPVQGLIRVRKSRVSFLETEEGPFLADVRTAIRDREGTWWLGGRDGGIDRIRDGEVEHLELVEGGYRRPIACIFEDSRGTVWFTAAHGSVFSWNGTGFDLRFSEVSQAAKVNAIAEDPTGRLWFGGDRGLCVIEDGQIAVFTDDAKLQGHEITSLFAADDGRVFAGTVDGHIAIIEDGSVSLIGTPAEMSRRYVSEILVLEGEEIWVTTIDAGLFVRRDGKWHRFSRADGLPDERLTGLVLHGTDQFWIGSLGGIIRVSRSELIRRLTNSSIVPRWVRLDRSDGMNTRECVGGAQPGVFDDGEGALWFPTTRGVVGVRPEEIRINLAPPSLHIDAVEIDGIRHPAGQGTIVTGPGRVQLVFHFVGVSLSAPEKVTYRIRLDPLDRDSSFNRSDRTASYQAVPPGSYTFEVQSVNGDGVMNILPETVSIVVRRHFWETPLFITSAIVVLLLAALASGWVVARRRMRRSLEALRVQGLIEGERSRISRDLHDDLGASLTELSILSALGAEDEEDANLRPTMETLSQKSKEVVGALDEIVWAATPREDTLRSLVDYIAASAREFLENAQVGLDLEFPRSVPDLMIGPRRRHSVFLTTREALNNAVKYSGADSISLSIDLTDAELVVTVSDRGKGFDLEYAETLGNGLTNLRQRMRDCGGACSIDSIPGEGTTVTIRLPLPPAPTS